MRLILFVLSIIALLFVGALIGPSFVDWDKYKPQIIEQVKKATGLDVQIAGDLSLSVLPSPRVKVSDIVVLSPKKIQFDNLLSMKSAEVSVALMPLLQKKIEVKSVALVEPDIQIEIMPDGAPSWMSEKLSKAKEMVDVAPQDMKQDVSGAAGKALEAISLNKLEIKGGKLSFVDHRTKAKYSASDINVVLKADSLKGPFDIDGTLNYEGKKITLDVETGKLPARDEALSVQALLGVPEAGSSLSFNGLAAIQAPYDVQGQTTLKVKSPAKLAALFGVKLGGQYNQPVMLDGLLSADENKITYNDLKFSLGDFMSNGKIVIQDLKTKNPLRVSGVLKSSSLLNLDPFLVKSKKSGGASNKENLKNAGKASAKNKGLVPDTLTMPIPVDINFKLDMAGVKMNGQQMKGVFVDIKKSGAKANLTFKALELPGQGKLNGTVNIAYAGASKSSKTGQVVYSDPSASYQINGQANQLAGFLKAFAPDADTAMVTKLYKSAQFNLKGAVSKGAISLKDSTLKLDKMVLGLGGRYQPSVNGSRAKAVIDLTAGTVDFDRIMAANGGASASSSGKSGASTGAKSKGNAKEALKPLQGFSLPMDLIFDLSVQKARINQADLNGLRLTGSLVGKKLTLKNASVNNFAGAVISLKGQVANLSNLSGLDLDFYTKTNNVRALAQALKVDISKMPKGVKAVEASVSAKGAIDKLAFSSNVKAMGGQLDAAGSAGDILGTPSFSNLSIGVKHPNLVKAIQIISPDFKGDHALQKPIDFYTKASINGKAYNLSGMKVSFGSISFGGDLKIDAGRKIPSVRGSIKAGKIALDSLLGAKTASAKSSGSAGSKKSGGSKSSAGRWSKTPIDLKWMNGIDVDVALAASSISYGGWNFLQPSTDLKIANGVLDIKGMKAGVFGGQANLTTQVKASPLSLSVSNKMSNIDLEALVKALSGSGKLKSTGRVSFSMDVQSTGGSSYALVNALNGSAELDGKNVVLKGFDLAKMARGLAVDDRLATSVSSLVDGATRGGQTKFDTIKGDYKITNGTVNIQSMVMDSPDAVINSTGYADIPKWFINVDNEISLKSVPDLKPFKVKIKGPIDNPSDTFGKNILEDYLGAKIKRKLAKELPDILGDDVTDKLKKFGILPNDPAPAPAPSPQRQNQGGIAPSQPQSQPPEKQQPVNPLDQILKDPENAEDALKDVLKGLF